MTTTTRDRLHHAIGAWAATRSGAHSLALNAAVDSICTELDMLRAEVGHQAEALDAARDTIGQLQRQVRDAAAPAVLQALEDLTTAYRALAGIDGAFDQALVRAEVVLISARNLPEQVTDDALFQAARNAGVLIVTTAEERAAIQYGRAVLLLRDGGRATPAGTWAGPSSTACDDQMQPAPEGGAA